MPSPATLAITVALALVATLSLNRAFASSDYLAWALPAGAAGAAFALTLGRKSLGAAFGLLVVVWLLTLPALFMRDLTIGLLPTREALTTVLSLLQTGLADIAREAPPVPIEPRYLLVVWTAGLSIGFLGASWVVVGRPLGAIVTSLGVLAFSGSVGVGGGRNLFALAGVIGLLAFLLIEGRHRIGAWARRRAALPAFLGIPTMFAASIVGLAAPSVFGAEPLVDIETPLRPRLIIIKPLADIQRQLQVDPPVEVLRVSAERPAYWRLTALDTYRGNEWVLEARPHPTENGPVPRPDDAPQGPPLEQHYRITSLLAPWLPAAFGAEHVDTPVPFEVDLPSSTLLLRGETAPGLSYTVTSRTPLQPTETDAPAEETWDPDPVEERFGAIAQGIVGDTEAPLQQAMALERHFRGFEYDEEVPGGHSEDRLRSFIDERVGYCEQFAATMTLMLRGLGIPARVGVGFLPGGILEDEFVVSTQEAHAWVEAKIPGVGWMIFEPTPGRGEPASGTEDPQQPDQEVPPPPEDALDQEPEEPDLDDMFPEDEVPDEEDSGLPIIPFVLFGLAIGAIPGAKSARRALRRSQDPRARILAAHTELLERASELGWQPGHTETEREFTGRAFSAAPDAARAAATRIVELALRIRYGPGGEPSDADAAVAWGSLRSALAGLRGSVSWGRRVLGAFDPRTLLPRRT